MIPAWWPDTVLTSWWWPSTLAAVVAVAFCLIGKNRLIVAAGVITVVVASIFGPLLAAVATVTVATIRWRPEPRAVAAAAGFTAVTGAVLVPATALIDRVGAFGLLLFALWLAAGYFVFLRPLLNRGALPADPSRDPQRPEAHLALPRRQPIPSDFRRASAPADPIAAYREWVHGTGFHPVVVGTGHWKKGAGRLAAVGPVALGPDKHCLVGGKPGQGKTIGVAIPCCYAAGSLIASSDKPDLAWAAGAFRAKLGPTFVVDISGTQPHVPEGCQLVRWDPVWGVGAGGAADTDGWWDAAREIAKTLAPVTQGDSDSYWMSRAEVVVAALLLLAALGGRDIAWVLDRFAAGETTWEAAADELAEHGAKAAARELRNVATRADRELSGIVGKASEILQPFQSDFVLSRIQDKSVPKLDIERFVTGEYMTLFVHGSEESHGRVVAAVVASILRARWRAVDQKRVTVTPASTISWVADELATFGAISKERLTQLLAAGRSRGVVLIGLLQSVRLQLAARYGRFESEANVDVTAVLLQIGETDDTLLAQELAQKAGSGKVERRTWRRQIVDVDISHELHWEDRLSVTDVLRGRDGYGLLRADGDVRWVRLMLPFYDDCPKPFLAALKAGQRDQPAHSRPTSPPPSDADSPRKPPPGPERVPHGAKIVDNTEQPAEQPPSEADAPQFDDEPARSTFAGKITVRIVGKNERFSAAVETVKSFGGKFDGDSKTWSFPGDNPLAAAWLNEIGGDAARFSELGLELV